MNRRIINNGNVLFSNHGCLESFAVADEDTNETEDVPEKNGSSTGSTTRYSKSQARQRYKRGKLQ